MTTNANSQDTADPGMADFVAKYGAGPALEGLQDNTPVTAAPVSPLPDERSPTSLPPGDVTESEQTSELDAATLQALGLAPPDASPPGENAENEGTEQSAIDLASLAKTLGLDASDISLEGGELKLTTKVDGERAQVSMGELRKGYQLQKHFTRQNEEFLQQKQAWEQARQTQETQAQQLAHMATNVLDAEELDLNKRYTRNWDQLRQDDPAEYAAQVADYNQKLNRIKERKNTLVSELQQREQQAWQEQQQQLQQAQQSGRQVIAEEFGWNDEKTFVEGGRRLRDYMVDVAGFQPQEIDGIRDPRPFLVSEKARKYDEIMAKANLAGKRVAKAHKVPAGQASTSTGGKQRALRAAQQQLAKTGSEEDAASVFAKMGIV